MQELTFDQVEVVAGGFLQVEDHQNVTHNTTDGGLLGSPQDDISRVCGDAGGRVTGGSVTTSGSQSYGNENGTSSNAGIEAGTSGVTGSLGGGNNSSGSTGGSASVSVTRNITCNP